MQNDLYLTQIATLYQQFLGRDADEDGLVYWVERLEGGVALDDVAQLFVESQEMQEMFYLQPEDWDFFL